MSQFTGDLISTTQTVGYGDYVWTLYNANRAINDTSIQHPAELDLVWTLYNPAYDPGLPFATVAIVPRDRRTQDSADTEYAPSSQLQLVFDRFTASPFTPNANFSAAVHTIDWCITSSSVSSILGIGPCDTSTIDGGLSAPPAPPPAIQTLIDRYTDVGFSSVQWYFDPVTYRFHPAGKPTLCATGISGWRSKTTGGADQLPTLGPIGGFLWLFPCGACDMGAESVVLDNPARTYGTTFQARHAAGTPLNSAVTENDAGEFVLEMSAIVYDTGSSKLYAADYTEQPDAMPSIPDDAMVYAQTLENVPGSTPGSPVLGMFVVTPEGCLRLTLPNTLSPTTTPTGAPTAANFTTASPAVPPPTVSSPTSVPSAPPTTGQGYTACDVVAMMTVPADTDVGVFTYGAFRPISTQYEGGALSGVVWQDGGECMCSIGCSENEPTTVYVTGLEKHGYSAKIEITSVGSIQPTVTVLNGGFGYTEADSAIMTTLPPTPFIPAWATSSPSPAPTTSTTTCYVNVLTPTVLIQPRDTSFSIETIGVEVDNITAYSGYVGAPFLLANIGSTPATRFNAVLYTSIGISVFIAVVLTVLFVVLAIWGDVFMDTALANTASG